MCERKDEDVTKSYTAKLLKGNQNYILKKIVEEACEFTF
ncbi:phosphoribosyl-ATP pyrophosphatase, partial [Aliarcobacter butzleri]